MEKVIRIFLLLFLITNAFSQNKAISPKNGIIVFKCIEVIQDAKLYETSKKEFLKSMIKGITSSVKDERDQLGKQTDSLKLKKLIESGMMESLFSSVFSNNDTKFHLEYQDSIVNKGEVVKDLETVSLYINSKTRKFDDGFTGGFYDYSKNKIIDVKEDRKSLKKINGFKCFKLIYSFKETSNKTEDDFSAFVSEYTTTREMWVTDEINSQFHPIVNDKIILDKYYPLEIIETFSFMKGMILMYTLDRIEL